MATADRFYVDPSAIVKLYCPEPESRAMARWRMRTKGALPLTHHGRLEVVNTLCVAVHRRLVPADRLGLLLGHFEEDRAAGHWQLADLSWRSTWDRAAELSRQFSPVLGTRALDVLHVASALELGARVLVTFDHRQQRLAAIVGLKPLAPAG